MTTQNYSTFHSKNDKSLDQCESSTIVDHNNDAKVWKIAILVSFFIAILAYFHGKSNYYSISPAWSFDYNVYIPKNEDLELSIDTTRISLIAQVAPCRPLQRLVDITSRVNRAYAKEWGMDYTRYNSWHSSDARSCFEKIFVLKTLLDKQNGEINESLPIWAHSRSIEYDSIILLPPDAILADLDKNVIDMILPTDKLAAIGGWNDEKLTLLTSTSGIIALNMKHKYTHKVVQNWSEMVKSDKITCGANNAFGLFLTAVTSVMNENESLNDIIEPLAESSNGFVGDHLIKSIVPPVPGSRSIFLANNIEENELHLQNTADSVCYRFYPKCEVL